MKTIISKGFASKEAKHTIEVRAAGVDSRDLRDGHIDGCSQGRLVRHFVEALHDKVNNQSKLVWAYRSYLHRIDPLFSFTVGEGSPLASDERSLTTTGLNSGSSIYGREERKEESETQVLDGHLERPFRDVRERGRRI